MKVVQQQDAVGTTGNLMLPSHARRFSEPVTISGPSLALSRRISDPGSPAQHDPSTSTSSTDRRTAGRKMSLLEAIRKDLGLIKQTDEEAALEMVTNMQHDTGFQRHRLHMEAVGVNTGCSCLALLYFLILVAMVWDLILLESFSEYAPGDNVPSFLLPLTNYTSFFEVENPYLSPQGAETLVRTGNLVSEDPPEIFPSQGGAFTYLHGDEDTSEKYIADFWISDRIFDRLRQVTFYISFESPEFWNLTSAEPDFILDVDAKTCWRGGNCDSAANADFKLVANMSEEQALSTTAHTTSKRFVRQTDASQTPLVSWWFTAFQYTTMSANSDLPSDKSYYLFRLRRNEASEAAFRVNADGYLGTCDSTNYELCTPSLYLMGAYKQYEWEVAAILLAVLVVFNSWWLHRMYQRNKHVLKWSREQKWLVLMATATFLLINPFGMVESMISPVYYQLIYVSELTLLLGDALMWSFFSFFLDAPSRPIKSARKFYAPKLLYIIIKFLLSMGIQTCSVAEIWSSGAPGSQSYSTVPQSWTDGRLQAFGALVAMSNVTTVFGLVWWFLIRHRGKKIMRQLPYSLTRSLQLQFHFASSIMTALVVLVAVNRCWWAVSAWNHYLNVDQNDLGYLRRIQRFVMAYQASLSVPLTMAMGATYVAFTCCMQFFFMPADDGFAAKQRGGAGSQGDKPMFVKTERERLAAAAMHSKTNSRHSGLTRWHDAGRPTEQPPILTFDTAIFLLKVSNEAYRCFSEEELEKLSSTSQLSSDDRMVDSELHDSDLIALLEEPSEENIHDTHCLIMRHRPTNRLIVSWRGTKTRKQMDTDLQASRAAVHTGILLTRPPGGWLCSSKERVEAVLQHGPSDLERGVGLDAGNAANRMPTEISSKRDKFLTYADDLPDYLRRELQMSGRSLGSMMKGSFYGKVHAGFWGSYNRLRESVHNTVLREILQNPGELVVTGHSLGGALSTLCAYDMAIWLLPAAAAQLTRQLGGEEGASLLPPLLHYTYGSPRVFSPQFAFKFNEAVPQSFRLVCDGDVVTSVPTVWMGYSHCGVAAHIDKYGTGSIVINPSMFESHIQLSGATDLRVGPHFFHSYLRALEGCMSPVEDEEKLRSIINGVYLRHTLPSWNQAMAKFKVMSPSRGRGGGGGEEEEQEKREISSSGPPTNTSSCTSETILESCQQHI